MACRQKQKKDLCIITTFHLIQEGKQGVQDLQIVEKLATELSPKKLSQWSCHLSQNFHTLFELFPNQWLQMVPLLKLLSALHPSHSWMEEYPSKLLSPVLRWDSCMRRMQNIKF